MRAYTTPGVYFEWLDASVNDIQIVRTDVAGFVGFAERGPLHEAVRVDSWTQFRSTFGRHMLSAYLAYAVEGFFLNGGRVCYVVRVADPATAEYAQLRARLDDGRVLTLRAISRGRWGNRLRATFTRARAGRLTLVLRLPSGEQEQWRDLTFDEGDARFAVRVLNGDPATSNPAPGTAAAHIPQVSGSRLVRASLAPPSSAGAATMVIDRTSQTATLSGGEDGLWTIGPEHLSGFGAPPDVVWGLTALETVRDVSIVAMPDAMPQFTPSVRTRTTFRRQCDNPLPPPEPSDREPDPDPDAPPVFSAGQVKLLQQQLVAHCEKLRDRVAVLDARFEDTNPQNVATWRREFTTKYAALYYPWLRVAQPDHIDTLSPVRNVPPSGHVAGIFARVEREVGVHKPPANELVEGAKDVTIQADDVTHGYLNDERVNVIRTFNGRGVRVAGARTLSSESEWRYVNVRRLLLMIERALERSTQWLVFEPNNQELWRDVDRVLRSFLEDLWRRGMLDGATAADAFDVACDGRTMSADDIDRGHLIGTIGVQPPWPAEFVIARIGRTESGLQIIEGQGDGNGRVGRA